LQLEEIIFFFETEKGLPIRVGTGPTSGKNLRMGKVIA
jgi:hypothetical protein